MQVLRKIVLNKPDDLQVVTDNRSRFLLEVLLEDMLDILM